MYQELHIRYEQNVETRSDYVLFDLTNMSIHTSYLMNEYKLPLKYWFPID